MIEKIKAWFTPARRKAIYVFGGAIGVFMLAVGFVSPLTVSKAVDILTTISGFVMALTNLLAALNVPKTDV